ncbi:Regulator of nonsense transcripts 2 [Cytospora mali]|uniref:Regulator of nonsense transcripts 2 n=1 Tax=Cytospora mali TaxID=578113 RepID=A0A194VXF0_CYTMA|nr:Regulator of nonsense transcripts 2 [Valsa mali]
MDRARKRELRSLNERAWAGETDLFDVNKSLDSKLAKHTAFIKRLRTTVTAATLPTFIQEIRTLSLHRYLSEIISACYEGLTKLKATGGDVEAGVEIVSALHQRFGPDEFSQPLAWQLGRGIATLDKSYLKTLPPDIREKEEKQRPIRQKALLRVITDLWLVGVLRTLDDVTPDDSVKAASAKVPELKSRSSKGGGAEPFPLEVLKDLLGHDRDHSNLPLLVTFVKTFSWDILGIRKTAAAGSEGRRTADDEGAVKSADGSAEQEDGDVLGDDPPLITPELQERFKNILKRYFEDVKAHVVRDQKAIFSQSRKNAEAYVKSGEVFEDRQANFDKQVKAQERLVANAQILADVLGLDMPDLKDNEASNASANGGIGIVKAGEYLRGQGDGPGIWQDEDERRFYENLADLKGKVPGILLEDGKKKKPEADEQVGKKLDSAENGEALKPTDTSLDDQSTAIANKTIGAQVDAIILRLPDLTHKEIIDQTAIDFCFLNSKASRNRLIKALTDVPKNRGDLLPSWARLIATLGQYMPDIPKGVIDYLDTEFRSLQARKSKEFLAQVRIGNIRYLAELTKFGIVPEHTVFHCLKVCLDDFSKMNIQIICDLLENCGRYLLRNPETSPRMASFLETLQRKKSVQHIGPNERMLVENAVYYVDPPERPAIQQKERTPLELFVRKLIYVDLSKRTLDKIARQIRRMHWEEVEVREALEKVFSKPGKVKYGAIHLLASLLAHLYRYRTEFVVRIIDNIVEAVCVGLEQNDFKNNQRRIAEVKYLAEIYNYRLVEHQVVFDVMYKIMTFGHGGPPAPGRMNPFDMPDDYFRIRMVYFILEASGVYFNKGAAGKKLDYFLSFLQYYIFTKNPLPMDIEFLVHDIYTGTRPQWKLASNFEEASKAFQLVLAQDRKAAGLNGQEPEEQDDEPSGPSTEDEMPDGDDDADIDVDSEDGEALDEDEEDEDDDTTSEESADEAIIVTRQEEEIDPEDDAEFEREYAKMMAESLESRKLDRRPVFDVALPVRSRPREASSVADQGDGGSEVAPAPKMAFSLLTKKGNKQQTRTLELPADSHFAVAMRNQQQAEREEQQRIKNLVLNYDLRENESEDGHDSKPIAHHHNHRFDKVNKSTGQRVKKLQFEDFEWT